MKKATLIKKVCDARDYYIGIVDPPPLKDPNTTVLNYASDSSTMMNIETLSNVETTQNLPYPTTRDYYIGSQTRECWEVMTSSRKN